MITSTPPSAPADLAGLLRQAQKSVSLDYIKWWAEPGVKTPTVCKRQGRVVTMQDATPARLAALPSDVLDCRLIALEFTIDFACKG